MKTYIFEVELHREEDGRWSAWIEALPGCAAWGYSTEEALAAIKDAAEAYVEDMLDAGEELPRDRVRVVEAPVVTITL
ncbi:MAG: type II toxin-antitoxin system HicB family antitoxin [Candidatus Entotheonellia bacterium]